MGKFYDTNRKDKTCQQCNGTGKIFFRMNAKVPFIDCDICKGTGEHEQNDLWFMLGKLISDWRSKKRLTLRECSRQYHIDPSNLSKMERGIIKPDSLLVQLACGRKKV